VTGGTLDGAGVRDPRHRIGRGDALAAYTRDAAWFTGEQDTRGRLLPGYDADLCVPTLDPFECPDDELRGILSDLTVMDGRITHDSGALSWRPGTHRPRSEAEEHR
jgi:predicted amidohydrolase YtcJ